jgi:hypothetical protein
MTQFTIDISDTDMIALNNDLVDVHDWIQQAVVGKTANCRKRMIAEWQPILFSDPAVTSIPATEDEFIQAVVARDDYKTRAERQAEADASMEAQ